MASEVEDGLVGQNLVDSDALSGWMVSELSCVVEHPAEVREFAAYVWTPPRHVGSGDQSLQVDVNMSLSLQKEIEAQRRYISCSRSHS